MGYLVIEVDAARSNQVHWICKKGNTFRRILKVIDKSVTPNVPFDTTGYSARMDVKAEGSDENDSAVLTFDSEESAPSILTGQGDDGDQIILTHDADTMDEIDEGIYDTDLIIRKDSPTEDIRQIQEGIFEVTSRVTKEATAP